MAEALFHLKDPSIYNFSQLYQIRGNKKRQAEKPRKLGVRQILLPGGRMSRTDVSKYYAVTRVLRPVEIKLFGELVAVVRPQNWRKTGYNFWTVPTLMRTGNLGLQNVLIRRIALLQDIETLQEIIPMLAHHGKAIKAGPETLAYYCNLLDVLAQNYINCETSDRIDFLGQILSSLGIIDSLGRYNPSATAAKLAMGKKRLLSQAEFDLNTIGSMTGHRLMGASLGQQMADDLWQLQHLFGSGRPRLAERYAPELLERLVLKPGVWAKLYFDHSLQQAGDNWSNLDFGDLSRVFAFEHQLWQIDEARSLLDHNKDLRTPDAAQLLLDAVGSLPQWPAAWFDPDSGEAKQLAGTYPGLQNKLVHEVETMLAEVGNSNRFVRANHRMENALRNRAHSRTPRGSYWRVEPQPFSAKHAA